MNARDDFNIMSVDELPINEKGFENFSNIKRYQPIHFIASLIFGFLQKSSQFSIDLMPYFIQKPEEDERNKTYYFKIYNKKLQKTYVVFGPSHDGWDEVSQNDLDCVSMTSSAYDLKTLLNQVLQDKVFKDDVLVVPFGEIRPLQKKGIPSFFSKNASRMHWAAYIRSAESKDYVVDPKNAVSDIMIGKFIYPMDHFLEIAKNVEFKNMNFQPLMDINNCGKWLSFILEQFITDDRFPDHALAIDVIAKKHQDYVEWVQYQFPDFVPLLFSENHAWYTKNIVDRFNEISRQVSLDDIVDDMSIVDFELISSLSQSKDMQSAIRLNKVDDSDFEVIIDDDQECGIININSIEVRKQ